MVSDDRQAPAGRNDLRGQLAQSARASDNQRNTLPKASRFHLTHHLGHDRLRLRRRPKKHHEPALQARALNGHDDPAKARIDLLHSVMQVLRTLRSVVANRRFRKNRVQARAMHPHQPTQRQRRGHALDAEHPRSQRKQLPSQRRVESQNQPALFAGQICQGRLPHRFLRQWRQFCFRSRHKRAELNRNPADDLSRNSRGDQAALLRQLREMKRRDLPDQNRLEELGLESGDLRLRAFLPGEPRQQRLHRREGLVNPVDRATAHQRPARRHRVHVHRVMVPG